MAEELQGNRLDPEVVGDADEDERQGGEGETARVVRRESETQGLEGEEAPEDGDHEGEPSEGRRRRLVDLPGPGPVEKPKAPRERDHEMCRGEGRRGRQEDRDEQDRRHVDAAHLTPRRAFERTSRLARMKRPAPRTASIGHGEWKCFRM